jgi:hypothetical protein
MTRLTPTSIGKIDEALADMIRQDSFEGSALVPVLIRAESSAFSDITAMIADLGGRVRGTVRLFGAIGAWLPLVSVNRLVEHPAVVRISIEEQCAVA